MEDKYPDKWILSQTLPSIRKLCASSRYVSSSNFFFIILIKKSLPVSWGLHVRAWMSFVGSRLWQMGTGSKHAEYRFGWTYRDIQLISTQVGTACCSTWYTAPLTKGNEEDESLCCVVSVVAVNSNQRGALKKYNFKKRKVRITTNCCQWQNLMFCQSGKCYRSENNVGGEQQDNRQLFL